VHLESEGGGVPRLCPGLGQGQDGTGQSGSSAKVGNSALVNGSPVVPWIRQLLPTVHSRLLSGGTADYGINEENGKVGLERRGGGRFHRTQATIHHGSNTGPF